MEQKGRRKGAGIAGVGVGDSLFGAGTVMSNDPQSRRWAWTTEACKQCCHPERSQVDGREKIQKEESSSKVHVSPRS